MKKYLVVFLLLSCVYLDRVDQPSSVEISEQFIIIINGNWDAGGYGGSAWLGMMLPKGFQVDSVTYLTSDSLFGTATENDSELVYLLDSLYPCDSNMCWHGFVGPSDTGSGTYTAVAHCFATDSTIPGEYHIDYLSGAYYMSWGVEDSILDRRMEVIGSAVSEKVEKKVELSWSVRPSIFRNRVTIRVNNIQQYVSGSPKNPSYCQEPVINIYNINGSIIKSFLLRAGHNITSTIIDWDGTDQDDHPLPCGVYFVQLLVDEHSETKKVLLLK